MRIALLALASTAALTACVTEPTPAQQQRAAARAATVVEDRDEALAGLTAGAPVTCINTARARSTSRFGNETILYRVGSNLVYRNDPPNGCGGMNNPGTALVTQTPSTQLCRGDIVRVVDTLNGFDLGACALGDFVPYSRDGQPR